jgi:LAS superfamily LD-carboxypeptidase LdcB
MCARLSSVVLLVAVCLASVAFSPHDAAVACEETFVVKDETYVVPEHWCEQRVNPSERAAPERLVELPDPVSYAEYRIYLRDDAASALLQMVKAAQEDGRRLIVDSGFRSAAYQRRIIERRLALGWTVDQVLRNVAPPGYSQHETGRAVDFVPSQSDFADTAEYRWLAQNAPSFGFVETFPRHAPAGRLWEPWHWYYAGDSDRTRGD